MHGAIWMLSYDVAVAASSRYLDWFHNVHIPEKLARPGYTWATHYAGPPSVTTDDGGERCGYIAMFGGESTRTFLDPSPAQLKLTQDALTREMMGMREHPLVMILAHEWSDSRTAEAIAQVSSPGLGLWCADAPQRDEQIGAWCAQELAPGLIAQADCLRLHKLSNVMAGPRHALVQELSDVTPSAQTPLAPGELGAVLAPHTQISMRYGTRIWPALTGNS